MCDPSTSCVGHYDYPRVTEFADVECVSFTGAYGGYEGADFFVCQDAF